MSKELKKRILTAIFLFPLLLIVLIYSKKFLIIFLSIFYFLSFYEIVKNSKSLTFTIIASIFLFLCFYCFYYLRGTTNQSLILLSWAIFSTILSDIGGYVFGKMFKGKKLTKISPNKTYSGAFGSLILSLVSLPSLYIFQIVLFNKIYIDFFQFKFFFITLFISLVAQIGDIFISFWKRRLNVKDTSNFLPGHGGVLDRIDGLIFVLILCSALKIFKII